MKVLLRTHGLTSALRALLLLVALPGMGAAASPLADFEEKAVNAVFTGYVSSGIKAGAGFIGRDGSQKILTPYGAGLSFLGGTDKVRIGSQSKTMTGTVILRMIDKGWFALDSAIGDLARQYNVDLGYAGLPGDSASLTVAQLLNMSSRIPNYMAGTIPGHERTLWDEWMAANYGAVPGVTHADLAALGLAGYPEAFDPGTTGKYSNTNSILLSLIAEAVYAEKTGAAKSFDQILADSILTPLGLSNTSLTMGVNTSGVVTGHEAGKPIDAMDTTIPWTSGAVVSTISEQLAWLRELTRNSAGTLTRATYEARMASMREGNASVFPMGGMPLLYGYNLFTLDLVSQGIDMTIVGHGGSIAGYSNFFGWYDQLDLGIVSDAASLTTIDSFGKYTNTPSEALYLELARHASMLRRSAAIDSAVLNATARLSAIDTGAHILTDPATLSGSLVIDASGRRTTYLDLNNPNMVMTVTDPTLIFYNATDGPKSGITCAFDVSVAPGARVEAYGAAATAFAAATGGALTLNGSVAAYGPNSRAVLISDGAALETGSESHIFAQGGNATGLAITGAVGDAAFRSLAELYGTGAAVDISGRTVEFSGKALAKSTALSMDSSFTTVRPDTHTAYAVRLRSGATLNSSGDIAGVALYPWDGKPYATGRYESTFSKMPGSIAAGVLMNGAALNQTGGEVSGSYAGIALAGNGDKVTLNGANVSGGLYSIGSYSGAGGAEVKVLGGSALSGAIRMGNAGGNVLSITGSGVIGNLDLGSPAGSSLTVEDSSLVFNLGSRSNPLVGADNVGTLDLKPGTAVTVVLDNSSVGNGASFTLIDDITRDNSSALPSIVMGAPQSKALGMALTTDSSRYVLGLTRDLMYYRNRAPNASLGAMLDAVPEAYAAGALRRASWAMLEPLETMDDPRAAIGQLQPLSLADITLSELRRVQALHRTFANKLPVADGKNPRFFAFGELFGQELDIDATGQELSDSTLRGGGVTAGMGYRFCEGWNGGVFVSHGETTQRHSGGRGEIEDRITRMGLLVEADLRLAAMLWTGSVGLHDVTYSRGVRYMGEKYSADAEAMDFLTSLAFTRDFSLTDRLALTPRIELAYINNHADSYAERAGNAALAVRSTDYDYLSSSLGGDLRYSMPVGNGAAFLSAGADWWHQYLDRPRLGAAMADEAQCGFTTAGRTADDDMLRARIALGMTWSDFSVQCAYERLQSAHSSGNELFLSVKYVF